jgi:transposase
MMGERRVQQEALFYEFSLERHVPETHLLRHIDRFVELDGLRRQLVPFYSEMGRPSIDPELLIRMLIVGYCLGIRSERRLCEEVHSTWRTAGFVGSASTARCRSFDLLEEPAWPLPRQQFAAGLVRDGPATVHR